MTVIYNPVSNDIYFAERSKGATLNGKKISVSSKDNLKMSVVLFHLSSRKEQRLKTLNIRNNIFEESMHMRMYGSCLSQMSYIASGRFETYFNIQSKPWDILPGVLLVQEAGGIVTDIKGKEIDYNSTSILATNGKIHNEMLKLLENI